MAEQKTIVKEAEGRKIVLADSAAAMDESNKGDVFVDGSHCGMNVGEISLHAGVGAMIGNDAGMGKNDGGIAGHYELPQRGRRGPPVLPA